MCPAYRRNFRILPHFYTYTETYSRGGGGNYANEKKRRRKTAMRLYANNEATNTVPAFTMQKRMRGIAIAMI
jgi:hypothetical protein